MQLTAPRHFHPPIHPSMYLHHQTLKTPRLTHTPHPDPQTPILTHPPLPPRSGIDQIKLGYVSRATTRDNRNHVILGTQAVKPRDFAAQMNLNMDNCWGIISGVVNLCFDLLEADGEPWSCVCRAVYGDKVLKLEKQLLLSKSLFQYGLMAVRRAW